MSEGKIPVVPNVNTSVTFAKGQVPDILRRLEEFLGVPLSLRSSSGEVVCKTDYFGGPCSILRGTEPGRLRCRRTYANIEEKLLRRKTPFVNICWAGFLIFAVPIELQGEMIGTILGAQIMPQRLSDRSAIDGAFGIAARSVGLHDLEPFFASFKHVKTLEPDFQRISFLEFLKKLGDNFSELAFSEKTWPLFYREIKSDLKRIEAV
ncbi:MAG: PocR ligand-binding domain-containing protein [Candidatus Riflebacteria bacterium]|nr:PocR ligand-binding domain-containing protein [Candidatus Riflebacteria bacterium]